MTILFTHNNRSISANKIKKKKLMSIMVVITIIVLKDTAFKSKFKHFALNYLIFYPLTLKVNWFRTLVDRKTL